MRGTAVALFFACGILLTPIRAYGQAYAEVTESETLNSSGHLAVQIDCYAYGDWFDPYNDVDDYEDYAGVSIGSTQLHGCQLNDPNGQTQYYDQGPDTDFRLHQAVNLPVTVSGTWDYWASSWIWTWKCNPDYEDCSEEYPYDDLWGYTTYAGDPLYCSLNDGQCEGPYSGDELWTIYYNMEYAYTGDSSTGDFGTFYVDALAVDVSPSYYTLEAGESVTFTAEASNTAVFLPFFQWTLVSGPSGTGSGAVSGDEDQSYTYIAPAQITPGNTTATIKGCATNLTSTPVCYKVTVDLIAPTVSIAVPSPQVLLADDQSTSLLNAYVNNAPPNPSVVWTVNAGTAMPTGALTGTYTAPLATAVNFGTANTFSVNVAACYGSPQICSQINPSTNITLVQPVSIATPVTPAVWTAGTTIPVTITGGGFGTNPSVTFSPTSWGAVTVNSPCTATSNTSITCSSVSIPLNLTNIPSQPVTITVSTPSSPIPTQYSVNQTITPVVYTYTLSLQATSPSLTYGYSTPITPTATCKAGSATCPANVFNPQTAGVNYTIKSGFGALSVLSGNSITYTDNQLIGYPGQSVVVQGCLVVSPSTCGTANISIQPTVITLSPATLNNPLTGGKTQAFNTSVQNPGMANQLVWTLTPSPSNAAPGTVASANTAIAGTATSGASSNTYTAPATISTLTNVSLTACMTANTSICATPVAITLDPPPTFAVTISSNNPAQAALSLGHTASYTVTVTPLYGFSGTAALSVSGLPVGVTASFSPASISGSAPVSVQMSLTSAYSTTTQIGSFPITITGTSSSLTNSASYTLTTRPLQYKGDCGVI